MYWRPAASCCAGDAAELLEHDEVQRAYLGKDYQYKWEK